MSSTFAQLLSISFDPAHDGLLVLDAQGRLVRHCARPSGRPAGSVVQLFFIGNMPPTMVTAGMTYLKAEIRVCNAYRLDELADAARWLVGLALLSAVGWLMQIGRKPKTTQRENRGFAPVIPA